MLVFSLYILPIKMGHNTSVNYTVCSKFLQGTEESEIGLELTGRVLSPDLKTEVLFAKSQSWRSSPVSKVCENITYRIGG